MGTGAPWVPGRLEDLPPAAGGPGVQHRTETHETFLSDSINSGNNVTSPGENIFLFHRLK